MKRYERYADEIAQLIKTQVLRPGDRLPSVRQASASRKISPSTVFQAYYLLEGRGLIERPVQMIYTDFSILVGMAYVYFPLMVLPLYAAMEKLDFRLVEAAYDLYATRWRVLRRSCAGSPSRWSGRQGRACWVSPRRRRCTRFRRR